MRRTRPLHGGWLIPGLLAVTLGCAAPTRPDENRAAVTGPARAESSGRSVPHFAAGGPNAQGYGANEGYPVKAINRLPFFVGMFSHYDQLLEGRTIRRAASPSRLLRAPAEPALRYEYQGETRSLDDYLARNPATGLLIARGDTILVERYQYARTDLHRFTSFSMAKTITAMLVGIAIAENLIRSVDDVAGTYVPALADTEYGRTSLRHLLQMSSGVRFRENYSGQDDVARLFGATVLQHGPGGVWQRTNFGYGYQTLIFAGERRMFALIGVHGQAIYVDPSSRLVMVHTAVRERADDPNEEAIALWLRAVDVLGTGRRSGASR
jgi:CubicO group peptidase (beta-lactamase class C family)